MKIPRLVFMSEIKTDVTLKYSFFSFLLCFKITINQFIAISHCDKDATVLQICVSSVFTGYGIGCKRSLQLKNSLKFYFDK